MVQAGPEEGADCDCSSFTLDQHIVFGYYILEYSTGDKQIDERIFQNEIIDVQRNQYNQMVVMTTDDVFLSSPQGMVPLSFTGSPMDVEIGDITGSVAVLNDNGTAFYFPSGSISPSFHTTLNGSAQLVGITEQYATPSYIPEEMGPW